MAKTNKGKKYRDRQTDERRVVYYLRRNLNKLNRILRKASK